MVPGGVNHSGEAVRPDGCDALRNGIRTVREQLLTQLLDLGKADYPVAVAGAVDDDNLAHVGQFRTMLEHLVDLGPILGDHDTATGVGDDVRDIAGEGRRIHGGRRGARAYHREIDENPLVARR